jgi:DASS family divalent anion:Na+ symporter
VALARRLEPEEFDHRRSADRRVAGDHPADTASPAKSKKRWTLLARTAAAVLLAVLWWTTPPAGVTVQAWRLFAIFAASIFSVVVSALPILTASVLAVGGSVLAGLITPEAAYAGFGNPTILLIVVAFLVANAVVKCGLGRRGGHLIVSKFGRSTLGLGYSLFLLDAVIAPAFPSSTARSGILYPFALSLAEGAGANPNQLGRQKFGAFLMFCCMASLSVSGALWMTAMVANPLGAEIARGAGVEIHFGRWLLASCIPTISAIVVLPLVLYWVIGPEVRATPEAPAAAKEALKALGPLTHDEWIVLVVFLGMVALWASSAIVGTDPTAVAFVGLGLLLVTGVITLQDISKQGDVLATFIWFAALFSLSNQLNELGFMGYLGQRLAGALEGLRSPRAGVLLVFSYVLLHYLFVSMTAHMLALFGVFLDVGVKLGVNPTLLAFQLLFATNYFSVITPQASSSNLLFAGSGYLPQGMLYRLGALTTAVSFLIYVTVGTAWMWLALVR